MRRFARATALFIGFAIVLAPAFLLAAGAVSGTPRVVDGDTLVIAGKTVHLAGVDAPELGQMCRIGERPYDCGLVARTALLDLTAGTPVRCEPLPEISGGDADNGEVARCFAAGYDLSEGMAYTGWALAAGDPAGRYEAFESGAREAGRGMWKGAFVAPWSWRRGDRLPERAN